MNFSKKSQLLLAIIGLGLLANTSAFAFSMPEGAHPFCYKKYFNFLGLGNRDAPRNYYNCVELHQRKEIPVFSSCGEENIYPGFKGKFFDPGKISTIAPRFKEKTQHQEKLSLLLSRERDAEYGDVKPMPLDKIPPGKGVLKLVDEVDLEADVLSTMYCHKKNPEEANKSFQAGYDVPANFISYWNKEYLKFKWDAEIGFLSKKYNRIDLLTFYELNLRAADWWKKGVACEGSDENLRMAIAANQWNCSELPANLASLQSDVYNYLYSYFDQIQAVAPKKSMNFFSSSVTEILGEKEYLDYLGEKFKYNELKVPAVHPLLTHFFMGVILTNDIQNLSSEKGRLLAGAVQFVHMLPRKDCNPIGLWPSNMAASLRENMKNNSRGKNIIDHQAMLIDCTGEKLPDFYIENASAIQKQLLSIYRQYQ